MSAPLDQIRKALTTGGARLEVTRIYLNPNHKWGVQVHAQDGIQPGTGRWKKVGPIILPTEEQTLGDLLKMLGDMAAESDD